MALSMEVLCTEAQQREQKQRKKYTATLEQLSAFEVLLDEVYVDLRPKPNDYDVRRDLLRIFNEIAMEIYDYSADAPVIEVFGSFSMDLFCAKSDLDLSINFTDRKVNITREKKIQTLRKFAKKFYLLQRNGFVYGVNPVTTARVPVLKVVDRGTEIECDISVENWDGISKSKTIYMIGAIDERFGKLSFLMKAWAKAQNINSAKDQTLNSLSIILLVAFHLQTRNPPILPPFSTLCRDVNESVAVEGSLCKSSNFGISNKESVAELFFSLLNKLLSVEKLWSQGLCASTFEGSWISKTWGSRVGHINVEDFADRSQNVARAVGEPEVKKIYSRIQLSVQYIFDFLNKKIEGDSLRKFLFGQDVASKLVTAGPVNFITKEIQARASGNKEVQYVEWSKGNTKTVHVDFILTKSMSSVESPGGMPQGKRKRTDDCFGGTFSEWSRRQPGEGLSREQPMPHYLTNTREPVLNRAMISREAVYNSLPPVSFEPTYGRIGLAEPSGEVHGREIIRHPNLIAPAVHHTCPSSQISYEPLRLPVGYSSSVRDSMHSSYFLPPEPRRF
ncbi:protein HESO1-like isoform X1 [Lycium ferocissimum]|uniref:protein HESO1-like isoform X1 n=2 Tax=Lycium ferocissimum TaxID=112874 RepID=UPI002814E83B|nr:protein HESO1-like isoform X1 [Lycium ferocissimum]XP_059310512.1 protein HESO1-like isoform X1 [Lycium ferocissimum]XP_059310513.1 protein HESO1-like isoform X1 [Lycium ferocissimum]